MKNSIKLRKTPAFSAGSFVATFLVLLALILGVGYGITEWWNHRNDPSFYSFKFNVIAVLTALLVTLYLSYNKTQVLLSRCNESGLRLSHLEPNSMFILRALVRGDADEHLMIIQDCLGSESMSDCVSVSITTPQLDYLEHEVAATPGESIFLAGTIRDRFTGNTTRIDRPVGFDSGCWKVGGALYVDLDHPVFKETVSVELEEEGHHAQHA